MVQYKPLLSMVAYSGMQIGAPYILSSCTQNESSALQYVAQFSDSKVFLGYSLPFDGARVITFGKITAIYTFYICLKSTTALLCYL